MWSWSWPYRSGCCRCGPACRERSSSADCCLASGRETPSRREVEPVRILVLNFEYPPVGGGGGRGSAVLAQALARRGHQLLILTTGIRGTRGREGEARVDGVRL